VSRTIPLSVRHELVGLGGVVERNWYLIRRYAWWELAFFLWTVANTLTIVFIAKGVERSGAHVNVERLTTVLLIGAVIWAYLGIIFEILTETVAWERWEGTIEYTFMAPLARPVHLIGMGLFAVLYGVVRAGLLFGVVALMFGLSMPVANFAAAIVLLAIASVSFIGVGMMTAVLPLISPEKGTQLGFIAQGLMLVVSGVYYPVSVLPAWMQWIATISPATYALRGIRAAILDGSGVGGLWGDIWPLIVIGAVAVPLGLEIFRRGEIYAKRHGKLKRSG
jgi:ABC-2 type transport system permease protein